MDGWMDSTVGWALVGFNLESVGRGVNGRWVDGWWGAMRHL